MIRIELESTIPTHAVNPTVINKAIYFDKVTEADSGMWPVGAWAHDADVKRPYYDPDKALEYLGRAGRSEGFEFTAVTNNSPVSIPSAEIIRAMLKKIGIKMNIDVLSGGPATERFFHGKEYPLYITTWSRYPEPDWLASLAYKSDGYYNAGNVPRPDVDKLVELGASLYALADRREVYKRLNEIVLMESWYVPLLYSTNYAAAPHKVGNLDRLMGWDAKMNLRELWIRQ